jgi:hypothetical protein
MSGELHIGIDPGPGDPDPRLTDQQRQPGGPVNELASTRRSTAAPRTRPTSAGEEGS